MTIKEPTLADRWWMFNYSWHRWRMKRAMHRITRNAYALGIHAGIIENHLGVAIENIGIYGEVHIKIGGEEDGGDPEEA